MSYISVPYTFTDGTGNVIYASQINSNFTTITDGLKSSATDMTVGSLLAGTVVCTTISPSNITFDNTSAITLRGLTTNPGILTLTSTNGTAGGRIDSTEALLLNGPVTVSSYRTSLRDATVSSALSTARLTVTGTAILNDATSSGGVSLSKATVTGTTQLRDATASSSISTAGLTVTGTTQLRDATASSSISTAGLTVTGTTQLRDATASSSISTAGLTVNEVSSFRDATFSSGVSVAGSTSHTGSLTVTSATTSLRDMTCSSGLSVAGSTSLLGSLTATSATTSLRDATLSSGLSVGGSIGAATFSSTLTATSNRASFRDSTHTSIYVSGPVVATGAIHSEDWHSYAGSVTIGGFSAVDVKTYDYLLVGKMVYCFVDFDGTSNANTFTFDLPENPGGTKLFFSGANTLDNGSDSSCYGYNSGTGTLVSLYRGQVTTGWTTSGRKRVAAQFFYRRA